jgi:hypothetical protein
MYDFGARSDIFYGVLNTIKYQKISLGLQAHRQLHLQF